MPLPAPNLDDLRFQKDLVDEARRRIIGYCPEWTDYNLSDPGITLIELFAWMTEKIVYRLNRVPERNYIKFLELLGTQLQPASSARVPLTFRLSTPFPINPQGENVAVVPQGIEVATEQTDQEAEVIFTTDEKLTIRSPKLTQVRRDKEFHKNYLERLGGVEIFYAFDQPRPELGNTFYLGFDENEDLSGHILRLSFTCESTQAVGIKPEDPPLVWECSLGEGLWQEISPSLRPAEKDTTKGLNEPQGSLVLYLPLTVRPDQVNGRVAYWLRARFERHREGQGDYDESPRIVNIEAHALGATTMATHAVIIHNELLGTSNGEAGQVFGLQHTPVLSLRPDETVAVEEERQGESVFVPWQRIHDFSTSTPYDRHFLLDTATGEIRFGPAVRQQNGTIYQYGRIPATDRRIRFSRYRYGGGTAGNVPDGRIRVLKSAVPFIDQVTNDVSAAGGRDQESLEEAKLRSAREMRAQLRAVTAEDYENLAKGSSRTVARVKCNVPQKSNGRLSAGTIEILIVPAVADSLKRGDLAKLALDPALAQMVEAHLDAYRLLTTTLYVREPDYLGVKVQAEIVPAEHSAPELVVSRVIEALNNFISPLAVSLEQSPATELMGSDWEGWPFGRNLYVAEIFSLIQRVPGVKHVLDVQLSRRAVRPLAETGLFGETPQSEQRLNPVRKKVIQVPADTLLCSLQHEITLKGLDEDTDD
jgi:predicted phage baseplate assembly protein